MRTARLSADKDMIKDYLAQYDTNKDGKLSFDEFKAIAWSAPDGGAAA